MTAPAHRSARRPVLAACIALAAASLMAVFLLRSTAVDQGFLEAADRAYSNGVMLTRDQPDAARAQFLESAEILTRALASGESAAIRFNRANALLRAGEVGAAIADYRRAQLLAPTDPRIEKNLQEARSKLARSVSPPARGIIERAASLWGFASERTRWFVALACAWAAVLAWLAFGARRRSIVIASLACATIVGSTVAADMARRADTHLVVVKEPTVLRKGNGDGFDAVLAEPLPAGTEATRRETRPGWTAIELGDGTSGWLPDSSLVR